MNLLIAIIELSLAVAAGLTILVAVAVSTLCLIAWYIHDRMERGRLL